ncbi:MAG: sigma-70 family RNA polymerase sigma factor [Phycisphaerae bacterium]|nr:sigma-70 family RNA polymerase sigma factor [Phycisphaerae bacterium]
MSNKELKKLVIRAKKDDLDAYGEIVNMFQGMAYGCAYSILGDFHLAEDVAQEAFVEAYYNLSKLARPEAFPGWFRRIVQWQCGRVIRNRQISTVSLDAAVEAISCDHGPGEVAEKREIKDAVSMAIASLPEAERTATTLFYVSGYSQKDIASFLEVSVSAIKNRLTSSRKLLRERMIDMIEKTLHENAPDKSFNKKVIEELLASPRLLEIEEHPIRVVYDIICQALPDYKKIDGEEIVEKSGIVNPWTMQFAIPTDGDKILRTETTVTTFEAMKKRIPPVHLITAGRVFLDNIEDKKHAKVSNQFDLVCVEKGANEECMKSRLQNLLEAIFGGKITLRYEKTTLPALAPCYKVQADYQGQWRGVAGCGVFKPEFLKNAGYDSSKIEGYAFAMGLENLAMVKYGVDDVHKLWDPHR